MRLFCGNMKGYFAEINLDYMEVLMPKKVKVSGPATPEDIANAYRQSTNPHDYTRLVALEMAQQGQWTLQEIATALGKHRATIARFLKAYRQGGLEALLARGHGGREARLKKDDIEALKAGLRQGGWKTAKQIRKWLGERGISMTVWGVYYWLKKVKAKNKVPRKTHKDQNPEALADFKANIVDKLKGLDIPKGRRLYIWVQDEHRYGLISNIRRCWTLRGHRVKVPFQMKYTWSYVYGAVEINTGKGLFMYIPTVSLQWSQVFLEQIVATDPEAIHIVIWDQAGFHHKTAASDVPSQIRLLPLPPYCPELNPMEKLWDIVKGHVGNKVFETLQSIEAEITCVLEPFWSKVESVFTLLGDNWLTRGVATFMSQRAGAESAV